MTSDLKMPDPLIFTDNAVKKSERANRRRRNTKS